MVEFKTADKPSVDEITALVKTLTPAEQAATASFLQGMNFAKKLGASAEPEPPADKAG